MSIYPEAASVVSEKIWMDDYSDSFGHLEQAVKTSRDLDTVLKLGGFVLVNFVSKIEEITVAMNPEVNETPSSVKEKCNAEGSMSHVLRPKKII